MSARIILLALFVFALSAETISFVSIDHPAIRYADAPLEDPVSRLDRQLAEGRTKLDFDPELGYLPSLLKHLGVNPDSQILVFSKTSFQAAKISPRAPRALFYSDDVAVGSVHDGDVLEFASLDPKQGEVFFTLDANRADKPRFLRRDVCLQCHQGPATIGIPGIMISSVYPDATGMPAFRLGQPVTDHRTPFQDRWGGWYVSGSSGGMSHKGNMAARNTQQPDVLSKFEPKFGPGGFMSQVSDIVALMTLEHQTRMTNLMTRVGWETRVARQEGRATDAALDADIEALVTYMLFADEAKLYDPIEGVSTFTRTFPERGPRDKQGRSLRDFDLTKRIFKYPCSYMIYSAEFDALPDSARERIYRRLYDVLSGKDQSPTFARLSEQDRSAVLAILKDTKKNLPAYW